MTKTLFGHGLGHTLTALLLSGALVATTASAHDFFLRPPALPVLVGETVEVQATVSSIFPGFDIAVTPDRIRSYQVRGIDRATFEVAGVGAKALKFRFSAPRNGLAILGLDLKPRDIDYPEDRVDLIMEEYEVDPAAAAAVAGLPHPRTLKVVSTRFAKSFVCVGNCGDRSAARKPLGYDLEFVASDKPGGFVLLSHGRPLSNYPVAIVNAQSERRAVRTGPDGTVVLNGPVGATMLFAAEMTAPANRAERFQLRLTSLTLSN
jgi:hypothetical protein